jgi:hypothetical protein
MIVNPSFYTSYVKLPPNEIPPEIRNNPHYFPFFKGCRGAVDGSLLDGFVSVADMTRYRSRKGRIAQNIFAACRFNFLFCYLLAGWEGSAADGRVFQDARQKGFAIIPGTYYLGNAGFPVCNCLLVPSGSAVPFTRMAVTMTNTRASTSLRQGIEECKVLTICQ